MEGRTLWITTGDVDGPVEEGRVVRATRPLDDFCLRGSDGSERVETGSLLEIIETRPWGAAMAQELPDMHAEIMQAALELEAEGLWEFVTDSGPECTPDGDIVTVERAVKAVRR